jgi:hypothetical protein
MPEQCKKTASKIFLTVMRNRISKLRKNYKEFKIVWKYGLSGAVGCAFAVT